MIKSGIRFLLLTLFAAAMCDAAANPQSQSFQEFRAGLLNDYNSFRQRVLDDYAKFLENAWVEYESFKGVERNPTPKPKTAPSLVPLPTQQPAVQPTPQPVTPVAPANKAQPAKTSGEYEFDFFGISLRVTDTAVPLSHRLPSPSDYGAQWQTLSKCPDTPILIAALKDKAEQMHLNGYLTYELVRKYVDSRYSQAHSSARMSLAHYILANMGYGVRLAATSQGEGLLLLPVDEMLYGKLYMLIDDKKYYIFTDDDTLNPSISIRTCELPADAYIGEDIDVKITSAPVVPYKPHPFSFSYGDITISGEVNENLMPMFYRYPQMEMNNYATGILEPELRSQLVTQLKNQLGPLAKRQAVDKLLQFTQSAFKYATDAQSHGFEKPYFLEEILYYPECDCEDRAVFYTYLLWNVLGVENQLIMYPGHESAAVCLDEPIQGNAYTHAGRTFYISDPTYIGSQTGQCMPAYLHTTPEIDFEYP